MYGHVDANFSYKDLFYNFSY